MEEEYMLITDKNEVDSLMLTYFIMVDRSYLKRALENFSKKEGFGIEFVSILFKDDLDEYDHSKLLKPLDDRHVLLTADKPAADENSEAYISFENLYEYLQERVNAVIAEDSSEKDELLELLLSVKTTLEV
ncbi:hypothetical protein CYV26_07415 [Carnobacterium maltaromaticum]|uniref:hypothetical protein n=1 Tax=Carnobacterium maltaromaticum TaxID=2751 RepID=UPI000C76A25A|nr:hypothetical protein [Carnobacterium maltaromaticum]PLS35206.1 hypothetical protein CYV30_10415 [Carnobacterium maltaromaticum]PLS35619.1 hypothetical protein CYV31_10395 [Carnobacterium maltaromaticum]PLS36070.1 hypothetical protein CYV33_07410 [Carnobacterium maltaromaticum]PLS42527.1 hypothetical protein CYV28_10355 [Carnobacterium maltaromaticum]PLS45548.1 hypothetical protein CYV27_07405 [Carnobacterium maltaromaticum]